MSYPLGTKVELVQSWRTYSKGAVLEQGYVADLETLVKAGIAKKLEAQPAKKRGAQANLGRMFTRGGSQ